MTRLKQVAVLGSTGSIGQSTLAVLENLRSTHAAHTLAARSSWKQLREQVLRIRPPFAVLVDPAASKAFRDAGVPDGTRLLEGLDGLREVVTAPAVDIVLSGIAGADGLPATLWAAEAGKTLAVANKESFVIAGELLTGILKRTGAPVVPVDSEHNAVFQALQCGPRDAVRRIVLTASGGAFRDLPLDAFDRVTPEEALKHPTWSMGPKITIDSATLMNKALEVIEARWLFDLPPERIEVILHPESIVHALVEFRDGSAIAQLSPPDMKLPIQYALTYPERRDGITARLDLTKPLALRFAPPDPARYPGLRLGYAAARAGGTSGAVLNAANEAAVALFLDRRIRFPEIVRHVEAVAAAHAPKPSPTLDDLLAADRWAREAVRQRAAGG
jgi:1-deoxy-D-xylulose-5-phosphate reductoisomerase